MSKIFVIDSGVGGFSILAELIRILPYNYLYLADQAYFPYGDKDTIWLKSRIETLIEYGLKEGATAVVIACNTATVHSIADLRAKYKTLIFGVEPVIKPLANYEKAACLTTASTAASLRVKELTQKYLGEHLKIIGVHSLASAVENMDQEQIISILTKLNTQFAGLDAIGLSCTHYPLIKKYLKFLYPHLELVDPSLSVAKQVKEKLNAQNILPESNLSFVTTGNVLRLEEQISYYLGIQSKVKQVKI